jgi:hypothetical protein
VDNPGATCGKEFFPSESGVSGLWEKLEQDTAVFFGQHVHTLPTRASVP